MRPVLIVASDFPPSSYPPALRNRFFAAHLKEFGWCPTVLTVKSEYYEWKTDSNQLDLLTNSIEVIRTEALPVKLTRQFGIGDLGMRSLWHHWQALNRICKEREFELIFISIPPYLPAILARLVYEKFKIPYVIDYIDPWTTANYWRLPKPQRPFKRTLSYFLSRIFEPCVLQRVGHIVGVSKGTTDSVLARYSWLDDSCTTEIPYGGEASDFDYLRKNPRKNKIFNRDDGFFHMSSVGIAGVNMRPTLEATFKAVCEGWKRSPVIFNSLRLHFIGTTYASNTNGSYSVLPLAKRFGLERYVEEYPSRVSYWDAIQVLIDSHALLALGSNASHYTPSKIFPYILARRPLLAIYREESTAVDILRETNAGKLVTFGNEGFSEDKVREVSQHLEEILSPHPDYIPPTSWEAFERYTARAMTERLVKVFDHVVSK